MDNLLSALNDVQREAVQHTEGPLLILSGAGSGKTRVITHRVAYLLKHHGISPFRILAVTFTNKAANEMKERLDALVEEGVSKNLWVATFHATCARILRRDIERNVISDSQKGHRSGCNIRSPEGLRESLRLGFGNPFGVLQDPDSTRQSLRDPTELDYTRAFTIYDIGEQATLVRDILRQLGLPYKQFSPRAILSRISRAKNDFIKPMPYANIADDYVDDYFEKIVAQVYPMYQDALRQNNALDFDDLLLFTVELFNKNADVLEYYQDKFEYILVDEYQDTNPCQYELVRLLAGEKQNICVVGDDDQSIYAFRGADIKNILNFENDYPNTRVLRLEQNYRSTQNILDATWNVVRNNRARKAKKLWSEKEIGELVTCYEAIDENDEAGYVGAKIEEWHAEGVDYSDFAIFYRTNAQSRIFEEALRTANIPYQIVGGFGFYERMEIKDMLAYLRVLCNRNDSMSLRRIINVPARGIGATTLQRIVDFARNEEVPLFDAIQRVDEISQINRGFQAKVRRFAKIFGDFDRNDLPSEALYHVLEQTRYLKNLESQNTIEAQNRIENIEDLINAIAEYEHNEMEPTLADYLETVALTTDVDTMETDKTDMVPLMTLHSAKGLEFPFVFIVGMEEGYLPHQRATESEAELEEERRLCYVGITRAMEQLFLVHAQSRRTYGDTEYRSPSRFVSEIPDNLIKHVDRYRSPFRETETVYDVEEQMPNYSVDQLVHHPKFGRGKITKISGYGENAFVTIRFGRGGSKRFAAAFTPLQPL